MKYKIARLFVATAVMSMGLTTSGVHAASIDTTGPNSTNEITANNSTSTNVNNNNNVNVSNNNSQNAYSGSASVEHNTTGGNATSGNATANNSTSTKVSIANGGLGDWGMGGSMGNSTASIHLTGPDSDNSIEFNNDSEVNVNNNNNVNVNNNNNQRCNSGKAEAEGNTTAGNATSGDATCTNATLTDILIGGGRGGMEMTPSNIAGGVGAGAAALPSGTLPVTGGNWSLIAAVAAGLSAVYGIRLVNARSKL